MYRCQSQQKLSRHSYENISSRMNRLRTAGSSQKILYPSIPIPTHLHTPISSPSPLEHSSMPRTSSCYRAGLKVKEGGMFGLDLSNHIGRVAKNTGIRKYNQRQIKEVFNRSPVNNEENSYRRDVSGDFSQEVKLDQRIKNVSHSRAPASEFARPSTGYSIKLYDYVHETTQNRAKPADPETSTLEPGKIYSVDQLTKML